MDKWSTDEPKVEPVKRTAIDDSLTPTGPTIPTGGNPPDIVDQLRITPTTETRTDGDYWVLGAHGGAGESTLAALDPHAKEAGHCWPTNPDGQHVVIIARESMTNLKAALRAGKHWGSGTLPGVQVIALVTIPAHPGKLHRDVADYMGFVAGGFPIHLRAHWHQEFLNHHDPREAKTSRSLAKIARDLHRISTKKGNTP